MTGWALTGSSAVYQTTNGGTNWFSYLAPSSQPLFSISFPNSTTGWVVGNKGTILKTTNGGMITFSNGNVKEYPESFLLHQNYPNPFNPVTKITFTIPTTQYTILKVYDALGREVQTLVDQKLAPGSHEVEFDGDNFSSGVYFYRIAVHPLSGAFASDKLWVSTPSGESVSKLTTSLYHEGTETQRETKKGFFLGVF